MPTEDLFNRFNRGEVDDSALARDDVDSIVDSCALMDNFWPQRLGPTKFRPGLEYISDGFNPTADTTRALIPLTRSTGDSIMLEFSGTTLRPLVDGLPYPASTATDVAGWANGDIVTDLTGWTLIGTPTFSGGDALLGKNEGIYQAETITAGTKQTFRITVDDNPVLLQVGEGSSPYAKDFFNDYLMPGVHFIQFTPTTTSFVITLLNANKDLWYETFDFPPTRVEECLPLNSGNLEFTVPALDYRNVSIDSSADVLFMALGANDKPRVFKRRGADSFSFEEYLNINGPYENLNTSNMDLTAVSSLTTGISSVSVDDPTSVSRPLLFESDWLGRLVKIVDNYYQDVLTMTAVDQVVGPVAVRGEGEERDLLIELFTGGFSGTVSLEVSDQFAGTYSNVGLRNFTGTATDIFNDGRDGELKYYRLRCSAFTSGSINVAVTHVSQAAFGYGIIDTIDSPPSFTASVHVYKSFMYTATNKGLGSKFWYPGSWYPGNYPQAVALYESRLAWASKNRLDLTVIDDYFNFDTELDSTTSAIKKTIGFGPVDNISWLESINGLFMGLPTTEVLIRSNNFDDPLTPLNTNLKPMRGTGSSTKRPAALGESLYYVSRDGERIQKLEYVPGANISIADQMLFHPKVCSPGVDEMVVSEHPEKRLWALTSDGQLRVLLTDPAEGIQGWARGTISGTVESICAIPNLGEDELWAIVRRSGRSQIEKLSSFDAVEPVDSFVRYTSPGTAVLTGLTHLEGQSVKVWADNAFEATPKTVSSGQITVDSAAYTNVVVGLEITAQYKSNKLTQFISRSMMGERKLVPNMALVLKDYAPGSMQVGRSFTNLQDLPGVQTGALVTSQHDQYFGFNGTSDPDPRLCVQSTGPATMMGLAYQVNVERAKTSGG